MASHPSALLALPSTLARAVLTPVTETASAMMALPGRVFDLVSGAEQALSSVQNLLPRLAGTLDRVGALLTDVERTTGRAAEVVGAAHRVTGAAADTVSSAQGVTSTAGAVVDRASTLTDEATPLLNAYTGPLLRLEPTLRRLAETTSPQEVDALVALVDKLPMLAEAMETDVLPLLHRLDRIEPDLHDLLELVADLNRMISRIPGTGRRRKRLDDEPDDD